LGIDLDVIEIDPAVYSAAVDFFDLQLSNDSSVNIMDGASYVRQLADLSRSGDYEGAKWSYVVHDCFSGGSVPGELFTREFWEDLSELLEGDGIVAVNFVSTPDGMGTRAVLLTLSSVFSQCRAFGDGFQKNRTDRGMINMVIFCTPTHSPLLSFRPATASHVRRSPLRAHVYTTFLQNEIQLDDVIHQEDWNNTELMLHRGANQLEQWQVGPSLVFWKAMQSMLTPEMWAAY